jgi:AraC-like DNA-binding protein
VRSSTLAAFSTEPAGRYVPGPSFAHLCVAPRLWGVLFWGRPDEDDLRALVRSLAVELAPPAVAHASIIDATKLEAVDTAAFAVLDAYVRGRFADLARQVTRVAIVRPGGVVGAVLAGLFEVLPRPYPVRVLATLDEALAWTREAHADELAPPSELARAFSWVRTNTSSEPEIVAKLKALLDERLTDSSIAAAARALHLSERTLQRRLAAAGTTFHDELTRARVDAARRLLLDTNAPLTKIALDVGCASLQHFSALFRKRTGESPSAFRARRVAARG